LDSLLESHQWDYTNQLDYLLDSLLEFPIKVNARLTTAGYPGSHHNHPGGLNLKQAPGTPSLERRVWGAGPLKIRRLGCIWIYIYIWIYICIYICGYIWIYIYIWIPGTRYQICQVPGRARYQIVPGTIFLRCKVLWVERCAEMKLNASIWIHNRVLRVLYTFRYREPSKPLFHQNRCN
jgi:hypothetical protein